MTADTDFASNLRACYPPSMSSRSLFTELMDTLMKVPGARKDAAWVAWMLNDVTVTGDRATGTVSLKGGGEREMEFVRIEDRRFIDR